MSEEERINKIESQQIDMRLAISGILATIAHHQISLETSQRNFETIQDNIITIVSEIRDIRLDMQQMQSEIRDIQLDVRGLQTENRRILDVLQNRTSEE